MFWARSRENLKENGRYPTNVDDPISGRITRVASKKKKIQNVLQASDWISAGDQRSLSSLLQ